MGTPTQYELTSVGLIVFLLPELVLCDCILGGTNIQDLVQRNKTILDTMNNTLMNYTTSSDTKISNFSDFQLWKHIQNTLNVTAENYLVKGVTTGRLFAINWINATQGYKDNMTDRTLEAYIRGEFLHPLHSKLQDMAVYYSFSLGVFRPREAQFNFTGINPQVGTTERTLDLTCMAGIRFLWRLSTSMAFEPRLNEKLSIHFAIAANMVENSFDQYYRKHDKLGNDFVRVNVLNTTEASSLVVVFMEAYFMNNSYTAENITSLTNLSAIPKMYFNNGTTNTTIVLLYECYSIKPCNYIANATLVINRTTTLATTASTATTPTTKFSNVTTVSTLGATPTITQTLITLQWSPFPNIANSSTGILPVNSLNNPNITISFSPNSTIHIANPNVTTPATLTPSITGLLTNTTIFNVSTIPPMTNTSTPTFLFTNGSTRSDFTNASTAFQATEVFSRITSISPAINLSNENTLTPSTGSIAGSINVSYTISIAGFQGTNTTTFSGSTTADSKNGSLLGNPTTTGYVNWTAFVSQNFTGYRSSTGFGNQSSTAYAIWTGFTNKSYTGYGNRSGFGNQSTSVSGSGNATRSTFDPDPYFQPRVPVIKRIYNDDALLRKECPMLPMTAKTAFFTITIPVALGIILFVILCLVCFQLECCPEGRKTEQ